MPDQSRFTGYALSDGVLTTTDLDLAAYLVGEYGLPLQPITYVATGRRPNRPDLPPPAIATFVFTVDDPDLVRLAAEDFNNGDARGDVKKCFIVRTSLLKRLRFRLP